MADQDQNGPVNDDAAKRERALAYQREYQRQRWANDPAYRERENERRRERYQHDPDYRARELARRADPEYRARVNARRRERRARSDGDAR